jgi:hypothetical protein
MNTYVSIGSSDVGRRTSTADLFLGMGRGGVDVGFVRLSDDIDEFGCQTLEARIDRRFERETPLPLPLPGSQLA